MAGRFNRRTVLGQFGAAATLAALGPQLARAAAESSTDSVICLSMIYGAKAKFDGDRFRDKHLPLLRGIYGDSLERIELRTAPHQLSSEGGSSITAPPPVQIAASVSLWIRDVKAFGEMTAKSGQEIVADLAKVTEAHPIVQYDQTVGSQGARRGEISLRTECVTLYYPNRDNARWDAKQYVESYLPKMFEAYGAMAIQRVEVCRGTVAQGGGKPGYISTMTTYIRDRTAYDMAGFKAGKDLMAEAGKATDIFPIFANLQVKAAG